MTNPEQSLRTFFVTYYRPIQLADCSQSCQSQYAANLRRLDYLLGREALLSDLTDTNIARVCGTILTDGRSPATANKVRAQLVALWTFAADRGLVSSRPTIRKYREYRREPTAWTREQLHELFEACHRVPGWIGEVRAYLWWLSLHSFLWDTGLRIGAALQVRFDQVDFDRSLVLIQAEQQKDHEDKWFRLHLDTITLLKAIRTHRDVIFAWPHSAPVLWHRYRRILLDAGLPAGRRDKFHKMRRSTASWVKFAGGDAQDAMGHSCPQTTAKYLDPTIVGKVHPADLLFRPEQNTTLYAPPQRHNLSGKENSP